jgi:hypothetical protein
MRNLVLNDYLVFIIQGDKQGKKFSIQRIYYIREDCDDDLQGSIL